MEFMKKTLLGKLTAFILLAAAAVTFAGCDNMPEEEMAVIKINGQSSLTLDFGTGTEQQEITVNSTDDWKAYSEADWVFLSQLRGAKGERKISVGIIDAQQWGPRSTQIELIVDNNAKATLNIKSETPKKIVADPAWQLVELKEGELYSIAVFAIMSSVSWEINVKNEEDLVFIQQIYPQSGSGNSLVQVAVVGNPYIHARDLVLTVTSPEDGSLSQDVVFAQLPQEPSIILNPEANPVVSGEGGEADFKIYANVPWKAEPKDAASAAAIDGFHPETVGKPETEMDMERIFTVNFKANPYNYEREIAFVFTSTSDEVDPPVVSEIVFTQESGEAYLDAEPLTQSVPAEGGEVSFSVSSNTAWGISLDDPDDWQYVESIVPESGEGDGIVSVTFRPNEGSAERNIALLLYSTDSEVQPKIIRELTFVQPGSLTEYYVVPSKELIEVPATGSEFTLGISSNTSWSVKLKSLDNRNDIMYMLPNAGNGDRDIDIGVHPTNSTARKDIIILISSTDPEVSPAIVREVTLRQAAGTIPPSPSGLGATPRYIYSQLRWNSTSSQDTYQVEVNGNTYSSNGNSFKATDLEPDTEYTWSVRAYRGRLWSDWSAPHTFRTLQVTPNPDWIGAWDGNVVGLSIPNTSAGTINLMPYVRETTAASMAAAEKPGVPYMLNIGLNGFGSNNILGTLLPNMETVNAGSTLEENVVRSGTISMSSDVYLTSIPEVVAMVDNIAYIQGMRLTRVDMYFNSTDFEGQLNGPNQSKLRLTVYGRISVTLVGGNESYRQMIKQQLDEELKNSRIHITVDLTK